MGHCFAVARQSRCEGSKLSVHVLARHQQLTFQPPGSGSSVVVRSPTVRCGRAAFDLCLELCSEPALQAHPPQ